MYENKLTIPITTKNRTIELTLFGENPGSVTEVINDASENGEAVYQIREGCFYEYEITDGYHLEPSEIVSNSKTKNQSTGRISPNIYVGTLNIAVIESTENKKCSEVMLEVQSAKTSYRSDYRHMLEEITDKCTDLLLQHSSPAFQYFEPDFNVDSRTLYQRFAFIRSVLNSVEFNEAVNKILASPVKQWREIEITKDIRSVKRLDSSVLRQFSTAANRKELSANHPLFRHMKSVPSRIILNNKTETADTPENRFLKHALMSFQSFCGSIKNKFPEKSRMKTEAALIEDKLGQYLSHSTFKEIPPPSILPLNSPVLQRKEGYREILRIWLMFDLAAKLVWRGGEDIYGGNKRDVAVLYEYWLFFKILDIIKNVFSIDTPETDKLIQKTDDGLGLQLMQGKSLNIDGIYDGGTRKLHVKYCYNKTFSGKSTYPKGGSWTRTLRPDYTLSLWPYGIEEIQAEQEELIIHIHFDAKYKIEHLADIYGEEKKSEKNEDDALLEEKYEQKKGTYKRADILKMHTYRDAIRRTAGAYVLYPGSDSDIRIGFHEIIPGLGAFAIRPSKENDGTDSLKKFLTEVTGHLMNRASQREKMALQTYDTHKEKSVNILRDMLPEPYGLNRDLLPDETYILVAWYKSDTWQWIMKNGLYNARAGDSRGSLRLGPRETGAKYILLHSENETTTSKLMKVTETGPKIYSRNNLIEKGYPHPPTQDYYLVYKTEPVKDKELQNRSWDITKLDGYKTGIKSPLPFSVSLTELMRVVK